MNFISHSLRAPMSKLAVAVATISLTGVASATDSIQKVSATMPTAQTTELNIDFDSTPIKPVAYQLDSPTRLVLDFPKATSTVARSTALNVGNIQDVTALSNDTTTRLVVTLNQGGQYTTRVEGNRLIVAVQNPLGQPATPVNSATSAQNLANTDAPATVVAPAVVESTSTPVDNPPVNNPPATTKPADTMVVKVNPLLNPALESGTNHKYNYEGVRTINYNSTATGGNVVIGLVNDSVPLDVQRMGDELVVRFTGATIPKSLLHQVNTGSGLVRNIVATNQGHNGVIRIAMNGDYESKAYQTGGQLNISIDQPKRIRQPTLAERTYSGTPLSMDFQDMSVKTVLNLLAAQTNTNIVVSDSVKGNITLRLIDVPWDQALDIILKSKNLDKRSNGKVTWVAPADELTGQEAKELEALNKIKDLSPLRTDFIRLSYAKAADVLTLIQAQNNNLTNNNVGRNYNNNENTSILSPRGTVTIDARTNTLIVKDTSDSIANVRELISKIDIPVKQVMIEARIVSATDKFSKSMGVKWGILSQGAATNRNLLVGGSETTINDLRKYSLTTQTVNGQSVTYPTYTINSPSNLNVNLGATNPAGSIAFGLLSMSDMMIDLELSAMQADGKGEVISTPKVLTADKQTAKVMSGTQIPYQEASSSGSTTTSFKDAVLSLEVTPNITPEGRIGMKLNIENGRPNYSISPPGIDKDSITTNVIVDDGQTVVLGGIFKNTLANDVTKVPFLGDLPYVGNLFKRADKTNDKQELLIFITPKLVPDTVNRIN